VENPFQTWKISCDIGIGWPTMMVTVAVLALGLRELSQ
jgi:hypothetical protein